MIKVFLILSVVVMAVTAVFGVLNMNMFREENQLKVETQKELKVTKSELADVEDTLADTREKLGTLKDERDEASAKLSNLKADLENKKSSVRKLAMELDEGNVKLKEFQVLQDKIGGRSIEDLKDRLQQMEQDVANKRAEIEKLDADLAASNSAVVSSERAIDSHVETQRERSASIARNAWEATITAVNNDWGFVIIDAGLNSGVTPDSPLLVNANGERIGRLHITSISPNTTIADIEPRSVPEGRAIQPGNRVIFEKTNN